MSVSDREARRHALCLVASMIEHWSEVTERGRKAREESFSDKDWSKIMNAITGISNELLIEAVSLMRAPKSATLN